MMFPLHFHYEDVSRQDPLLKPNHANVMEVPGSCEIRLVPNSDFIILFGKWAMEMTRGQRLLYRQKWLFQREKLFRSASKSTLVISVTLARKSALDGMDYKTAGTLIISKPRGCNITSIVLKLF
ncbi:60S ribosomal protein L5, mitochondrial [Apostasia shenzhenica]|uniref:60S ribosomal protein L5, mitochondrial n=1 Tax=Apostasia shenzhenica TaxID=1088818 RepID=A0A2H9ZRB7_9ASPA|nr:60S ribosomal protein L5, mitochondrial [Apostasia shenzhenica]